MAGMTNLFGDVMGGVKNTTRSLSDLAAQGITGSDPTQYRAPASAGHYNTGYYNQDLLGTGGARAESSQGPAAAFMRFDPRGMPAIGGNQSPTQDPGNNLTNPGLGEQAFNYTQNRLLEDPYADAMEQQYKNTQTPQQGEQYMNQNLGTLDGPGQGDQYWNQVQGQFNNPMAGEQYARQATQNFQANGPASAFYDQSMGQYDQMTNYQGGQNTQGQYGQSSASLAGGSQGEQGLNALAGQYGAKGSYNGPNNAMGQYQANAASGPLAGQSYYDSVAGQQATKGTYSDQNRAAAQYEQTQGAFGDMPIAAFDPFYDRARQLGVQAYNQGAAGRGVYGSSEALSGVGNVITDIEAQRANRSFDAEMQRAQEQRARQQLLGEQARMGDVSSLDAFGANLKGLDTFGNLAKTAGEQTLGQQTMLGQQARASDVSATDAFNANLAGVETFAGVNNLAGNLELDRNRVLGDLANNADTQATRGQEANIAGLDAFGRIANNADQSQTDRYKATTSAMDNADRTAIERTRTGADIAFGVDDGNRQDYEASNTAANNAAQLGLDRNRQGADLASQASRNDLERVNSFNSTAQGAEGQRQARQIAKLESVASMSRDLQNLVGGGMEKLIGGSQEDFESWFNATMAPALQSAQYDQQRIDGIRKDLSTALEVGGAVGAKK